MTNHLKGVLTTCLCCAFTCTVQASVSLADTIHNDSVHVRQKSSLLRRIGKGIGKFIAEFSTYDTAYIEPQHYKFQVMCQLSNDFDYYSINTSEGHSIRLSPQENWRVGPYAGYSLVFLGYTLQLNNLYLGNTHKTFNLSLYTAMLGGDFYYRNTNDFRIKTIYIDDEKYDFSHLEGSSFGGFNVKSWGFNTYYIFKHRRHSYPAAYNQSTCQKISSGAPLVGFGYGNYSLKMDWESLGNAVEGTIDDTELGKGMFDEIGYQCYSLYGGYSYNWVFARNWLLGASATAAISYNHSTGESFRLNRILDDFKISNITLDGIGRIGLVWNNTRLFAGASAQVHAFNYNKEQFSVSNLFGGINFYVGMNFGKKKENRKPGKLFEF